MAESPYSPRSSSPAIIHINADWKICVVTPEAEKLTGHTADQLIGKNTDDLLSTDKKSSALSQLFQLAQEGHVITRQPFLFKDNDGDPEICILTTVIPYPKTNGDFGGVVINLQNIHTIDTENQMALNAIADGVFTIDMHTNITLFNTAAENLTGWKSEEVLGKPCNTIFHAQADGNECVLKKSLGDGDQIVNIAIFASHKNGDSIPISFSSAPLVTPEGKISGGIQTIRDNTINLLNSQIVSSVAEGVFTVDRNWHVTSFNRAAEEITGWSRDDALGKSCSEIFHSSICGKNCAIAESLYSGAPVSNRSITIHNHRGDRIPISISAAPLTDPEGNIIGGVETFRDLTTITSLRKQLSQNYTFDEIISKAVSMQRLFKIMPEIARSPSTALILGESGTGKELVARALFNASERNDKPFVTVNCGALPETLLESELFGYKAGAFTDARKDKNGRFAAAEGGTLFLDEIGEIPGSVQVKLLRVLQEKIYEPLGSNTPVKADVRIITATNRDLQARVSEGLFREDLFYRLNVVKINLPPLRERKEDIPLLVDHFVKKYSAQQGKDIVGISALALSILMRHDYPGNIRELENIIEYSFILCEGGYIHPEHLPEPFAPGPPDEAPTPAIAGPQSLEQVEHQAIEMALERNKWKKMATCRELGISKDTLRRKIKKYDLKNPVEL